MAKNLLRRIIRWAAEMPHPAEQYYSPKLSLSEERALLRRNYLLLMTGHAALGLIGPEIRGIAIETRPDDIILHIAATADTETLREDINVITDDLDAYLVSGPEHLTPISTQIHVGQADTSWSGRAHDLLYLAKTEPPNHNS
ncbi:hypothetical protein ABH926_007207 [Catenulispora sp. GP43]|uniref:hypothetical protein n=1 Tax=Catenulispora sp. GP43 TaxID=3156263 RepID=UPI00351549A9